MVTPGTILATKNRGLSHPIRLVVYLGASASRYRLELDKLQEHLHHKEC